MEKKLLECPKLYKRCFRFAMALVRGWANREEEARDIVHDGYILAIRFTKQWKPEEISYEQWVIRKIRDAWRKWVERRSMMKRKIVITMSDVMKTRWDEVEEMDDVGPDVGELPRQDNLTYIKERLTKLNPTERRKLTEECGLEIATQEKWISGTTTVRDVYAGVYRGPLSKRHRGEAKYRCEPDVWAKRQIARCDLRGKGKDRAGARPYAH